MTGWSFLDVAFTHASLREQMDAAFRRVMDSGLYIGGPEVERFEVEFAQYCGAAHCVGVANGLDALVLALKAQGIGAGDEVIVPANTFIATWLAVAAVGAVPVPVDADPATMNMDLSLVEAAVTPRTRAIMPVHLYGAPVPCAGLRAICDGHGLMLLEDAAQAHGARDGGRAAGSLGDAAGFSFYPGKNLGAFGDGGAVVTDDPAIADAVRMLGNYGAREKYRHERAGGNSRLDPVQAAFLRVKLGHLPAWNRRRQDIAAIYDAQLRDAPDLTLPQVAGGTESVWHLYVLRHPARDRLREALQARGVPTALHYPVPNHHSGAFAAQFAGRAFPVTEDICATCLSLPIGPHLGLDDAAGIAEAVRDAAAGL